MSRWTERAIEVEAHAAMGGVEHAQAVIARELEQAWLAGVNLAAEVLAPQDVKRAVAAVRAEAAK